jgi:hypothetical protein
MRRYQPRDPAFLRLAILAGAGAVLDLAFSVGVPVVRMLRHETWSPAFFFFGVWGIVALAGCGACIATYLASGTPPERTPPGGVRERRFTVVEGGAKPEPSSERTKRAA